MSFFIEICVSNWLNFKIEIEIDSNSCYVMNYLPTDRIDVKNIYLEWSTDGMSKFKSPIMGIYECPFG